MFVGDLFLYAHWGEAVLVDASIQDRIPGRATILQASETHLEISILLGSFAVIGYLFGAGYIYRRFLPSWRIWGIAAGLLFAIASILGGTYHALWSLYGKTLQIAMTDPITFSGLLNSLEGTLDYVNSASAIPLMASISLFAIAIILNKTDLPRYMVILTPLPLLIVFGAFSSQLSDILGSPLNGIVRGSSFNMVMALFFAISCIRALGMNSNASNSVQNAA